MDNSYAGHIAAEYGKDLWAYAKAKKTEDSFLSEIGVFLVDFLHIGAFRDKDVILGTAIYLAELGKIHKEMPLNESNFEAMRNAVQTSVIKWCRSRFKHFGLVSKRSREALVASLLTLSN